MQSRSSTCALYVGQPHFFQPLPSEQAHFNHADLSPAGQNAVIKRHQVQTLRAERRHLVVPPRTRRLQASCMLGRIIPSCSSHFNEHVPCHFLVLDCAATAAADVLHLLVGLLSSLLPDAAGSCVVLDRARTTAITTYSRLAYFRISIAV